VRASFFYRIYQVYSASIKNGATEMATRSHRNLIGSSAFLAVLVMTAAPAQRADALVIGFEQSEGFPAPVLPPPPLANGPFTGFAGGPDTFGPQPLMPTNGGAVTNWGVLNNTSTHGTWYVDDGPGGLDILSGAVPTCTGPTVNDCDPAPVNGSAMGGFGIGFLGGLGIPFEGVMDLDNTQNIHLESFWYANRGNGPPRLQVEYYDTDDTTLLGVNTFAMGTDPNIVGTPHLSPNGDRWVGVGADFEPKFQLLTPTLPFQNVALGKVVFRSFADGTGDRFLPGGEGNGDIPNPLGHGHFFLDDITIKANGTQFNPNNYTRLSFEASEGFPDAEGSPIDGTGIINVVTNFEINGAVVQNLQIDHGPGGQGFPHSATEPDPIHGSQIALSNPGVAGTHEVTIDLHNPGNFGFAGLWYANRGNGPPRLTVEYYDLNENKIGENSYSHGTKHPWNPLPGVGDGDVWVGVDENFNPKFQFIEPSAPFQNVALSKIKIISAPPNPATGGGAFSMDDVLLVPGAGSFNPDNKVRVSFETTEGFSGTPGVASDFVGQAFPAGVVDNWGLAGAGAGFLQIDQGPADGEGLGDEDDPVSGNQFALSSGSGNGEHILTMDLTNSANLALESFWYANRGNLPPLLTVEYFGLNEASLGTDVYTAGANGGIAVGVGPGFEPLFQLIEPSAAFLGVPLSKLIFTSEHNDPNNFGAHFAIDDILFSVVLAGDADFDGDGPVTGNDFLIWQRNFGLTGQIDNSNGDANGDGVVDDDDLVLWETQYGTTPPLAGASAVPEPSSLVLITLAAVAGLRRRFYP
jgi:hypothetical protein